MLLRLTPEQIAKSWHIARPLLAKALPASLGIEPKAMVNVLYSLLEERGQLWIYYKDQDGVDKGEAQALVMTAVIHEPISKVKYLLIYTLTAIVSMSRENYEDGIESLRTFADKMNCSHMLTYVDSPTRVKQLESLGLVTVSTFMEL